jgi:hypothetical protein
MVKGTTETEGKKIEVAAGAAEGEIQSQTGNGAADALHLENQIEDVHRLGETATDARVPLRLHPQAAEILQTVEADETVREGVAVVVEEVVEVVVGVEEGEEVEGVGATATSTGTCWTHVQKTVPSRI